MAESSDASRNRSSDARSGDESGADEAGNSVLPPLPADEWGDAEYEAFGQLLGVPGDRVPRAGSGHRLDPANFEVIGVLVRHPELAKVFLRFNGLLLQRTSLSARLRELVILRVALHDRSAFEWAEHVKAARDAGITDSEVEALVRGGDGFEGDDRSALDATDELIGSGRLTPDSWSRIDADLGTHAAMELVFLVGTYRMLATAFATWGLTPPPDGASLPDRPT